MTEQDDMENWLYATAAGPARWRGAIPSTISNRWARLRPIIRLGGEVSTQITEQIARGFYRRWTTYMQGGDWNELLGAPAGNRQAAE